MADVKDVEVPAADVVHSDSGSDHSPVDQDMKDIVKKHQDDDHDDFDLDRFPVREAVFRLPFFKNHIALNPVVSIFGFAFLWGVSIWCMVDKDNALNTLNNWRGKTTLYFTWLFVGTRAVFFFFLLFITIRYGHIKLGRPDEPPEFSTAAYFSMIFAAGVAVGLFVFGVSEPLYHRNGNFFAAQSYRTQDERDMWAINMTVTNWAIAGWAPYLIVAVCMGLATFRFGMPTTFRSCFYPILGEYCWGWIGDFLDGYAIVVTVAGVCTSLGLGAIQIVAGFVFLGWVDEDISESKTTSIQNLTIWAITAIATVSVISGLDIGIKYLSLFAFLLGMLLLFLVFVMDNTKYLLNLQVQEAGYFMQWSVFQLNFWTDAFAQLRDWEGRATDGQAGSPGFMNGWVIFYQAWWVAWSCFVGLFVARISRGRTVGEVIMYSLIAPILYCLMWFCIWGGTGIRQARQAEEMQVLGEIVGGSTDYYLHPGTTNCYDVPQGDVYQDGVVLFSNTLLGVTPVCEFKSSEADFAAFRVLYSFSFPDTWGGDGFGPTLTVIFIISLAIYFATSSDSGSLIVDHLAANGRQKHHWIQRLFWAVTEGAVATALLSAGGSQALSALQAGSIVAGMPFVIFLIYLMPSIWRMCQLADRDESMVYTFPDQPEFGVPVYGGIFNIMEYAVSFGNVNQHRVDRGMDKPTKFHVTEFFKGVFVPSLSLHQVMTAVYPRNKKLNMLTVGVYTVMYYLWIGLFAAYGAKQGLIGIGWTAFFAHGVFLCSIRGGFREKFNIRSNVVADGISSLFFWPQVHTQMRQHCMDLGLPNDKSDEDLQNVEEES